MRTRCRISAEDIAMKSNRLNRRSFRTGLIVAITILVLAVSSASTPYGGPAVLAAGGEPQSATAFVSAKHRDTSIRPFKIHVPGETLADLHRRLAATRW